MANVGLQFQASAGDADPQSRPLLLLGQLHHLHRVPWSHVRGKLQPRVTEELWQAALSTLNPNPTDSCPLYLNYATVAALPSRVSRHNSPSAAHFVTRLVRTCLPPGTHRCILMVCERSDAFASACALARAFPLFTHRSGASRRSEKKTVTVEFFLVGQDNGPVEVSTLQCLTNATEGVRLAARIVDTPCNEMNTDTFLEEIKKVGKDLGITPTIIRDEELKTRGFGDHHAWDEEGLRRCRGRPGGLQSCHQAGFQRQPPRRVLLGGELCGSQRYEARRHPPAVLGEDRGNQQHRRGGQAGAGGRCVLRLQGPGRRHHPGHGHADRGSGGPLGPQGGAAAVLTQAAWPKRPRRRGCPRSLVLDTLGGAELGGWVPAPGSRGAPSPGGRSRSGCLLCFSPASCLCSPPPPRQGIATGKYHAAVLTNSAEWEAACVKAGRRCGDLVHPLVYCPELHFSEFTSAVADMKNSVAVGSQGARRAPAWGNPGDPGHSGAPQIHAQGGSPQSGDGSLAGLPAGASRVTGAKGAPSLGRLPHWLQWPPGEGRPLNPRARSLGSLSAVSWQRAPTPRTLLVATGGGRG
uniref:Aminopeptidase like 1 n=1 Tax=Canis lupus familiaris TaxID=9615 RepID=A0A8C0Z1K8_CANLF